MELAQEEDGTVIHGLESTTEEVPEPGLGQLFELGDDLFTTSIQEKQEFKPADRDDQKQLKQIYPHQLCSLQMLDPKLKDWRRHAYGPNGKREYL